MKPASTLNTSLPKRKHIRLPPGAYYKPGTWYFITICCRGKQPLLDTPDKRDLVRELLRQTATVHCVELAAYTILPNHLHVICSAGKKGLPGFVREFKSRTAVEFKRLFGEGSPWQFRYFDHKIRSEESLRNKCRYVWFNPVRRGLAPKPEDYPWSGALRTG